MTKLADENGIPTVTAGVAFARRCTTESLLTVLNERGFEAVPATVGPAVQRVVAAAHELDREDATRWSRAQASFYEATRGLLTELASTPENVERTPETVLRAMVASCALAETEAQADYRRTNFQDHYQRACRMYACRCDCSCAFSQVVNSGVAPTFSQPGLRADYEARLAGTRPLNAPPMEV